MISKRASFVGVRFLWGKVNADTNTKAQVDRGFGDIIKAMIINIRSALFNACLLNHYSSYDHIRMNGR
ncbi:hypothetical protein DNH61_04295 [Paenibacillus sambharensis]|uniref:Uncharacterized protein n=1 Tax=Paenibacillus sambharensis TaxID=1803190 RepID=A0A2W1LQJ2_9BACL|nr:hypothetical protein DNH61_04295 [Paenibacillus sambharensis]